MPRIQAQGAEQRRRWQSFLLPPAIFFLFFFFLSFVYLCRQAPDCFFSYLRPAHTVFAMAPTALGDFAPI